MAYVIDFKLYELENHTRRKQGLFKNVSSLKNFLKAPRNLKKILQNITKQAGCLFAHLLDEYSYSLMKHSITMKVSIKDCAEESGIYKQDIKKVFYELFEKKIVMLFKENTEQFRGDIIVVIPCLFVETETTNCIEYLAEVMKLSNEECSKIIKTFDCEKFQ